MNRAITRAKWIFMGLFLLAGAAVWAYQLIWGWPGERCEARGGWWDPAERICGQPIYIPDLTGRRPGETREEASIRLQTEAAADDQRARGG